MENGFNEITLHPKIANSDYHPDFLVSKDKTPIFYLESTLVYGSPDKRREQLFENQIQDLINSIHSQDFLIHVDFLRSNTLKSPKLSDIKKNLIEHLSNLNYKEITNNLVNRDFTRWFYDNDGWKIKFWATPVTEEARLRRTKDSRNIGSVMHPAKCIKLDDTIQKVILNKAKKACQGRTL
jgi:hypothetical protein